MSQRFTLRGSDKNLSDVIKSKEKPWFDKESKVIYRLPKIENYVDDFSGKTFTAILVDVETTGLSKNDEITSISIIPFTFDNDMNIISILHDKSYFSYNETKKPIPKSITEYTGIDDDLVRGHQINWKLVQQYLDKSKLSVAHNAKFDKRMISIYGLDWSEVNWACSVSGIDWDSQGMGSKSLPNLASEHGFFYNSHDAIEDCLATIHLLAHENENTSKSNFHELLNKTLTPCKRILCHSSPFNKKDDLKERKYRWDVELRCWWKDFHDDILVSEEMNYLENYIYKAGNFEAEIVLVSAKDKI